MTMMLTTQHAQTDDDALVAAVRDGDSTAFEELYRRHAGAVRAAVRDNVHDADGIADVVQEAFTRALARLDSLRDATRFRPWLLSIARHAAVDSRRHANRVGGLDEDAVAAIPSAADGPDVAAELTELADLLETGMATLSVRDATALSMVTHLGLRPAEVGAALGVTPGAAKVIVHRARRRLRDAVALRILVRAGGGGCEEFDETYRASGPMTAARHLRTCALCCERALGEVVPFDAGQAIPVTL